MFVGGIPFIDEEDVGEGSRSEVALEGLATEKKNNYKTEIEKFALRKL